MDEKILYRLVGAKIREIREKRNQTQEVLAKVLGATRTSVANYESGKQAVYLSDLYRIAVFLNVRVQDFLPTLEDVQKHSDLGLLLDGDGRLSEAERIEIKSFIDEASRGKVKK